MTKQGGSVVLLRKAFIQRIYKFLQDPNYINCINVISAARANGSPCDQYHLRTRYNSPICPRKHVSDPVCGLCPLRENRGDKYRWLCTVMEDERAMDIRDTTLIIDRIPDFVFAFLILKDILNDIDHTERLDQYNLMKHFLSSPDYEGFRKLVLHTRRHGMCIRNWDLPEPNMCESVKCPLFESPEWINYKNLPEHHGAAAPTKGSSLCSLMTSNIHGILGGPSDEELWNNCQGEIVLILTRFLVDWETTGII